MDNNYLLYISYVGTAYHGFQIQRNAVTVQGVFQQALGDVLGDLPPIKGCSRTDAGVHASEYCVSFFPGREIAPERLAAALNRRLPPDIRVLSARTVPPAFHARYSCKAKRYRYLVWNSAVMNPFWAGRALRFSPPIDAETLRLAASEFLGTHDFLPFSGGGRTPGDTERTVRAFDVERTGDLVAFSVTADGFLYHMVRIMAGTLLSVARGRLRREDIASVFRCRHRPNDCFTAPPEGLYLDRVFYGFEGEDG